jgi:hypothetical protein
MKLVYGIGINDADYSVQITDTLGCIDGKRLQKKVWTCPHYRTWKSMIQRCHSPKLQDRFPSYKDCEVCEEWLRFSNFKAWMETQDWEGKQLDKDLLLRDNKIYSPETCCFVSKQVNMFIIESTATRGDWPIGVTWAKHANKFRAAIRNPFTRKMEHIGYFSCPEEAHLSWLTKKLNFAKTLAENQTDVRIATALVIRYKYYNTNSNKTEWSK